MNSKTSWITLAILLLAIMFVPIIPNDAPIECNDVDAATCDSQAAYVSLYDKFFK